MASKMKKTDVEFNANDFVVYPTHGVGRILGTEQQIIAGMEMDVLIVRFEQDRMTLRVPLEKARSLVCGHYHPKNRWKKPFQH